MKVVREKGRKAGVIKMEDINGLTREGITQIYEEQRSKNGTE
jgi:hypothetical protein